jgi:hypothetical protein
VIGARQREIFDRHLVVTVLAYIRLADGKTISENATGPHPTEMVWLSRLRLAVACANTNYVYLFAQDGSDWSVSEKLNLSLTPRQPVGMTPSSLIMSGDGRTLYVACSDANAVAVADVPGKSSKVRGYIPTGWYPTTVRALRDGRILVLNGNGNGSHANPERPNPFNWGRPGNSPGRLQYVAGISNGDRVRHSRVHARRTFGVHQDGAGEFAVSGFGACERRHRRWQSDSQYLRRSDSHPTCHSPHEREPHLRPGARRCEGGQRRFEPGAVRGGGHAEPASTGARIRAARQLLRNADVRADGLFWTTAGIAPDSNQRLWPMEYARRIDARPRPNLEGARSVPGCYGIARKNRGFRITRCRRKAPSFRAAI